MPDFPWEERLHKTTVPAYPDLAELRKWSRSDNPNARRVATTMMMTALSGHPFTENRDYFLQSMGREIDHQNLEIRQAHYEYGHKAPVEDLLLRPLDGDHPLVAHIDHQIHRVMFADSFHPHHFHMLGKSKQWHMMAAHDWLPESGEPDPVVRLRLDHDGWSYDDRGIDTLRDALEWPKLTAKNLAAAAAVHRVPPGSGWTPSDHLLEPDEGSWRNMHESHPCARYPCIEGSPPPPLIDRIGR